MFFSKPSKDMNSIDLKSINKKLDDNNETLKDIRTILKSICTHIKNARKAPTETNNKLIVNTKSNHKPLLKNIYEASLLLNISITSLRRLISLSKITLVSGKGTKNDAVMIDVNDADTVKAVKDIRKYNCKRTAAHNEKEYLSIQQAAVHYQISSGTLYHWIDRGKMIRGTSYKRSEDSGVLLIKKNCPFIKKFVEEIIRYNPKKNTGKTI